MTRRVGKRAPRESEAPPTERSPTGGSPSKRSGDASEAAAPESMTHPKDQQGPQASQDAATHPDTIPAPAWFDEVAD